MQIKEGISVGKSSESMVTKGICVLVVNEDSTCNNIVSEMLHHCNYEVLHIGDASDVLNAIWETKDGLELILTNVHKLETNGIQIVRNIQKQLNLEIILMSPDTTKIALKSQPLSFAAYVLNGLSRNGVNSLWQFALRKEKANNERENVSINAVEKKTKSKSICETEDFYDKCKKNDAPKTEDVNEDQKPKKTRVNWTGEMHQKFLKAIEILGYEKAVPKKILEIMNVPGLTRENVASHLQKFRGGLKRTQEIASSYVLPSKSTSRLSSYLTRQRYNLRQLQQKSPYISNTSLDSYYLKTHKDSFFRAPERKIFRIYDDQTKNVLLGVNKNIDINHFSSDKFVGYRLTDDGTSIQFGNLDNRISKDSAPSLNPAADENQAQTGFSNLPQCHSKSPNPLIFSTDQEYSLPFLETHEIDFFVQNSPPFFDEISQQGSLQEAPQDLSGFLDQETIDDVPLDWGEFDDTFFNHHVENV